MSRLVVVSNRVSNPEAGAQQGGLAVALGDALRETGGLWFGWNGETVADGHAAAPEMDEHGDVQVATLPLSETDYERYYLGYSNRALWPVCHYRLDLATFDSEAFEGYCAVNRRFATALYPLLDPSDTVWIHDYHLIPLAAELRALGARNRIGYFLHIPFPPPEIVTAVPDHAWLIDTLFANDLIGFQTEQDVANFARYIEQTKPLVRSETHRYRAAGRPAKVKSYPIGIDAESFTAMSQTPEALERIGRLGRGVTRYHVIGVDRLDYSKGLPDRIRAFGRFLERYPEHRKETVLMQIAQPTREELTAYAEIRAELEQLSGALNGAYGDFDWTPVRYIHRAVARDTLAALFRGSRIALVTPLRDGMNLVAKEYIAAQNPADPGVLILSQFAGAAAELLEAFIVNPYDADEVADAMKAALNLPLEERRERHASLLDRVNRRDAAWWRGAFLDDLRREVETSG